MPPVEWSNLGFQLDELNNRHTLRSLDSCSSVCDEHACQSRSQIVPQKSITVAYPCPFDSFQNLSSCCSSIEHQRAADGRSDCLKQAINVDDNSLSASSDFYTNTEDGYSVGQETRNHGSRYSSAQHFGENVAYSNLQWATNNRDQLDVNCLVLGDAMVGNVTTRDQCALTSNHRICNDVVCADWHPQLHVGYEGCTNTAPNTFYTPFRDQHSFEKCPELPKLSDDYTGGKMCKPSFSWRSPPLDHAFHPEKTECVDKYSSSVCRQKVESECLGTLPQTGGMKVEFNSYNFYPRFSAANICNAATEVPIVLPLPFDSNTTSRRKQIITSSGIRRQSLSSTHTNEIPLTNDLKTFAEFFKQCRMKLGVTQADVGRALGQMKIPGVESLSQSTICRFESLTLSHTNMLALRPILQMWLDSAREVTKSIVPISAPQPNSNSEIDFSAAEAVNPFCVGTASVPTTKTDMMTLATNSGSYNERKRKRTCITDSERKALETYFSVQPQPSGDRVAQISSILGLKRRVVRVWFCNQRQKQKRLRFISELKE